MSEKLKCPVAQSNVRTDHDILCGGESTSILTYAAANLEILVVTKEDVDTLKDDWLTDNVLDSTSTRMLRTCLVLISPNRS